MTGGQQGSTSRTSIIEPITPLPNSIAGRAEHADVAAGGPGGGEGAVGHRSQQLGVTRSVAAIPDGIGVADHGHPPAHRSGPKWRMLAQVGASSAAATQTALTRRPTRISSSGRSPSRWGNGTSAPSRRIHAHANGTGTALP